MPRAGFATTRWSLVERARGSDPVEARAALEALCAAAWYPLYAYARRRGLAHEEACDATQELFADLLESDGLARAEPARGRLRSFLLGALQRSLARSAEAGRAWKRGAGRTVALEHPDAAERYRHEPADGRTPELLFEATWAQELLARVVEELRAEYERAGRARQFAALESELAGPAHAPEVLAERLGTTAGAAKVAAHRLRKRYREAVRQAVLATVDAPGELEDELAALLRAVAGNRAESS